MCWFCLKSWPWDCKRSRSCDFVTWCCEGFVTLPKIWLQNNQGSYKRCFAYGNSKLCNGLICHSRWLTTANRFFRLWVSQHWETGENLYRLREIIKFIVGVYYPMWFMIKTRRSRTQGPHHVLQQLRYVRKMSPSGQALIGKYIMSSAWNSHSERIMLSLLVGSMEARVFAVDKILHIRKDSPDQGDPRPGLRHNPVTLDLNANFLQDMIEWDNEVLHEPYLTCSMPEE